MSAMAKDVADKIVEEIIKDLNDRRGLRQEWDMLDEETVAEIKADWKKIALDKIMGF
jgi:uncharacterized lipoprotein YehR (DUF1307 family)